jgi:hypothetical protein
VMSLYTVGVMGATPVSGAVVGWCADTIGTRPSLGAIGAVTVVVGVVTQLVARRAVGSPGGADAGEVAASSPVTAPVSPR